MKYLGAIAFVGGAAVGQPNYGGTRYPQEGTPYGGGFGLPSHQHMPHQGHPSRQAHPPQSHHSSQPPQFPQPPHFNQPRKPFQQPRHRPQPKQQPPHYGGRRPNVDTGKGPCCTTGFPKQQSQGYSNYSPFLLSPLEDVELFAPGDCPKKTDEEICFQAGQRFAKPGTAYGVKRDYRPFDISNNYLYQLPEEVKQKYNEHAAEHKVKAVGHKASYSKNGFRRVDDPLIVKNHWWSDTDADLVVINDSCCFNVFPDVKAGEKLKSTCEGDLIGDTSELYKNFRYSILTPGYIDANCREVGGSPTCEFEHSVVAAQGWLGRTKYSVAEVSVTVGAPATEDSPIIVGVVTAAPGEVIATPSPGIVLEDSTNRLKNPQIQDEEYFENVSDRVAAQNCALSNILSRLPVTGTAAFDAGLVDFIIDCTEKSDDPCVVEMSSSVFRESSVAPHNIVIKPGGSNQVIVNVRGDDAMYLLRWDVTGVDGSYPIVWNIMNPSIMLDRCQWQGHILAPNASTIRVGDYSDQTAPTSTFSGSILSGQPGSIIGNYIAPGAWGTPSRVQPVPLPQPTVTLCSCLCSEASCEAHY